MSERLTAAVALLVGSLALASCSGPGSTTAGTAASGQSQAAAPLPDISKLVPSVQRQITEQHTWLVQTLAKRDATAVDKANAHGELGRLFMAAQMPDAALAEFLAAQSFNASDYRWPYFMAHLARSAGDLPKAQGLFEHVLQLKADDMDALVWLGDVSLAAGSLDVAERAFGRALQLDPNSVSAKYGAGRTALAKGDNRAAVTHLESALSLNPKATAAHYPLSQAYAALGDTAKAAEHLSLRRDGRIAPRDTLMVELDALLQDVADLFVDHRLGQAEARHLGAHEAAGLGVAVEHGDGIALALQVTRDGQRGRAGADAGHALAVLGQRPRDHRPHLVALEVGRHALEAADGHRLGLGGVLLLDPAAPAGRLAGPVAGAAEDAGEHVGHPVDHVGMVVATLRDQADVLGDGGVGRTGPLAIDDLVEVIRVGHLGGAHGAVSPCSAGSGDAPAESAGGRGHGLSCGPVYARCRSPRRRGNPSEAVASVSGGEWRVASGASTPGALRDGDAVQQPAVAVVTARGGVHQAAVVPQQQGALLPHVAVDELGPGLVLEQFLQQRAGFIVGHAVDAEPDDRRERRSSLPVRPSPHALRLLFLVALIYPLQLFFLLLSLLRMLISCQVKKISIHHHSLSLN